MAGTIVGGALRVREILPDQWPLFESIHMVADGEVTVTSEQSITRRLRVDDGKEEMEALFGEANLPGDVVLLTGLLSNLGEHLMSKAAEQIQEKPSGAGILFLFQPNAGPVDILDAGGPMRKPPVSELPEPDQHRGEGNLVRPGFPHKADGGPGRRRSRARHGGDEDGFPERAGRGVAAPESPAFASHQVLPGSGAPVLVPPGRGLSRDRPEPLG